VLIDQFLERAKEAEIDAIFDGDEMHVMGIMEHIEPAGIHSGDSSAVLPQYSLGPIVIGSISDHYTLGTAMAVMPVFSLAAAAAFISASRFYSRAAGRVEAIEAQIQAAP